MSEFVPISVAAAALGVSTSIQRRWEATGRFVPVRTEGGQRRYDLATLHPALAHKNQKLLDGVCRAVQEATC